MELDITAYMEEQDHMYYLSNSIANLGSNAGKITWENSQKFSQDHPLLTTPEMIENAREYFRSFGAWDNSEIDDWDNATLQAMMAQEIASRIRELEMYTDTNDYIDWDEYRKDNESGRITGGIYRSIDCVEGTPEGRYFIYIGN